MIKREAEIDQIVYDVRAACFFGSIFCQLSSFFSVDSIYSPHYLSLMHENCMQSIEEEAGPFFSSFVKNLLVSEALCTERKKKEQF